MDRESVCAGPGIMMDNPSVLIVEDEALHAFNYSRILKEMGFEHITIAVDALEAVHLAQKLSPDLVLMDIGLPGSIDGRSAANVILSKQKTLIIFITAFGDKEVSTKGSFDTPDGFGYVVEPYTDNEIKSEIKRVMSQSTPNAI
jgi:CheY-like chemotaxis protein